MALAGRPVEAIEEYRTVLELDPHYYEATRVHHGIGISLVNAGRFEEAVAEFERMVRDDPDSAESHNYLGLALLKVDKAQDAVAQFQHAVRLLGNSAQAECNLGTALAMAGQPRQAIEHFERALRLQPNYPLAHKELGRALVETDQPFAAIPHLEKALAADPKDGRAHHDFGRAWPAPAAHVTRSLTFKLPSTWARRPPPCIGIWGWHFCWSGARPKRSRNSTKRLRRKPMMPNRFSARQKRTRLCSNARRQLLPRSEPWKSLDRQARRRLPPKSKHGLPIFAAAGLPEPAALTLR